MRTMGLDYGSRTVGVAMTDALGITIQPTETIVRKEENKLRRTLARIEELVRENDVEEIVLGYPISMDGTEGERVEQTMIFKELLERRLGMEIHMMDERLTTMEADEVLAECGVDKKDRKTYIDQIAAYLILQSYLNKKEFLKKQEELQKGQQ